MAGFDYATAATPILKEVYLPAMQELLNNGTPLLKALEKEIQPVEGGNFVVSIHRGRNQAAAIGRAEDATLPTAGYQGYVRALIPVKQLYSRIRVSGKAIAATKSNKGSFVRAIESEMKGVMEDTKRELNRQVNGDGTGAIAYWTTADNTSGTTVDDGLGNATSYGYDAMGATAGTYDLIDASDNSTKLGDSISVTRGAKTTGGFAVTWSGTVSGSADGDYLVREDTLGYEMTGIQAVINNANPTLLSGGLHGLTVASYPDWVASVSGDDSAPVDLTFNAMQQLISKVVSESGVSEQDIKFWHCHPSMRDTYVDLCRSERAFQNNMKLDGGWETVAYNGRPFSVDVHCRRNALFLITPSSMAIAQLAPLDWIDKDGSVFYRISGGDVDAFGATAYVYQELMCKVRNQNGVIKGLNDVWGPNA